MMRAMVMREAERMARAGGFGMAVLAHAAWLSLFLAVWGRGVGTPLISGMAIYDQLSLIQWMLLVLLLPWAAARAAVVERGDALVRTAALWAQRPSRLLVARILALSMAMTGVAAAGLPMTIVAQRMSDVPLARMLIDQTTLIASGVAVAMLVTALQQLLASRVGVWLAATAVTCAVAVGLRGSDLGAAIIAGVLALATIAGAILIAHRSDIHLRYLSERTA